MSLWTGCRPVAFNAVLPYIDIEQISGISRRSRPRRTHIRIMADARAEHRTHDGHPYRIRPDVLWPRSVQEQSTGDLEADLVHELCDQRWSLIHIASRLAWKNR